MSQTQPTSEHGKNQTPKFKHDCKACKFLFHRLNADWYYCEPCDFGTLIARVGDEGYQYWSTPIYIIKRWIQDGFECSDVGAEAKLIVKELNL